MEIAMDRDNLDTVIESAYRQIFFHAFKSDRDVNLESQLKDGQITVRDFVRGLVLSDTFKRSFYGMNSNYKVVRHLVEKLLGRKTNKSEEIAWSIVIATKGVEGLVDVLLDSQEYLDAFGYDTVPSQRNRVLPGRELGAPVQHTSPRYDEYYRGILGFPDRLHRRSRKTDSRTSQDQARWISQRLHGLAQGSPHTPAGGNASTDIDYMSRVPYRSIGR